MRCVTGSVFWRTRTIADTTLCMMTCMMTTSAQIMDTFCPAYESDSSTLSDKARIQLLRAIGVAVVNRGSMFPTMEMLLR